MEYILICPNRQIKNQNKKDFLIRGTFFINTEETPINMAKKCF